MSSLNGESRDGRHHMQIRVYYEDTDFDVWPPFRHRIKKSNSEALVAALIWANSRDHFP